MGLFSTFGEVRRLARELKAVRQECEALRRERDRLFREFFEREKLLIDRILVVQAKTYPISEEAVARAQPEQTAKDIAKAQLEAQNEFLAARQAEFIADAREAGIPLEQAYSDFRDAEPLLLDQFQRRLGFE